MQIEKDRTYIFAKSGNKVRAITRCGGKKDAPQWLVERIDGASNGKRMIVSASTLQPSEEI